MSLRRWAGGLGHAARGALLPQDASVDLSWPALRDPTAYAPNRLNRVRLTFTDVATCPSGLLFLAAAEDSPDAVADGPVAGVVVGLIEEAGVRWCPLLGPDGEGLTDKAEGTRLDSTNPRRGFVVFDLDDPDVPTEMAEVLLEGPWDQALKA